jgi:hypothetical protein
LFSLDAPKAGTAKLSLAERQAQVAEEKKKKDDHERQQFEAHGAFWETLGSGSTAKATTGINGFSTIANSSNITASSSSIPPKIIAPSPALSRAPTSVKSTMGSFWDTPPPHTSSASTPKSDLHADEEEDFLQSFSTSKAPEQTSRRKPSPKPPPVDPFDFDQLDSVVPSLAVGQGSGSGRGGSSGMRTPESNFDFGDGSGYINELGRNDVNGTEDEIDILGDLAKPVPIRRAGSPRRMQDYEVSLKCSEPFSTLLS